MGKLVDERIKTKINHTHYSIALSISFNDINELVETKHAAT